METKPEILLVEDNSDDVELTRRAFSRSGVVASLAACRDGVEALSYLHSDRPLPNLILMDLKMPRLSGLELLRALRQSPRMAAVPVVVLTSSDLPEDIAQAYALGANSYIRKPSELSVLIDIIRQVSAYWLGLNQVPHQSPRATPTPV